MAHDLKTKAAAFVLFSTGLTISQVTATLKVAKATVNDWHKEWQAETGGSTTEVRTRRFHDAFENFGIATMRMLTAQADLLSDPAYIKSIGTKDAITHTEFIRNSLTNLNSASSIAGASALPERTEVIEGIPEDEG